MTAEWSACFAATQARALRRHAWHLNTNRYSPRYAGKAVDESYNTQPGAAAPIWNIRGIMNNSWDRINLRLVPETPDGDDEAE